MPGKGEVPGGCSDVMAQPFDAAELGRGLRLAMALSPQVTWITALDPERVVYLSPAFERLFGLPGERLQHSPREWLEHVHADDRARVEAALDSLCAGRTGECEMDYRIVDGSRCTWVRDRRRAAIGAERAVRYLAGVVDQIDHAGPRGASGSDALESGRSAEVLRDFMGGVVHSLNNALMSVIGYAGLAATKLDPERDRKLAGYLGEIYQAGHRAKDLVGNVLECLQDRPEERTRINLSTFTNNSRAFIRSILPSVIEIRLHTEESPDVSANEAELRFALVCLCLYAKNSLGGPGTVLLKVGMADVRDGPPGASLAVAGWPTVPYYPADAGAIPAMPFMNDATPRDDAYLAILRGIAARQRGQLVAGAGAVTLNFPAIV